MQFGFFIFLFLIYFYFFWLDLENRNKCTSALLLKNVFSNFFLVWVLCTGLSGLAVTYGLNLNQNLSWIIWNLCTLQTKIISVERIQQYAHVASEAPWVIEENHPPATWPSHGTIELQNLQVHNFLIRAEQHKFSSTFLTSDFCQENQT